MQKIIYLNITGSSKSCTISALYVILNLTPLPTHMKGVLARSALKIFTSGNFQFSDPNGLLKILEEMHKDNIWPKNSNSMLKNTE